MEELGFGLDREWRCNPFPQAKGFVNTGFVFRRS
jgi:hypothetical protein